MLLKGNLGVLGKLESRQGELVGQLGKRRNVKIGRDEGITCDKYRELLVSKKGSLKALIINTVRIFCWGALRNSDLKHLVLTKHC